MATTSLTTRMVHYRRTANDVGLLPLTSPTTIQGSGSTSAALSGSQSFFGIVFDGASFTTFKTSVKGYVVLGAGTLATATNSNLFGATASSVLAPWWDDLQTAASTGYVKFEVQGAAPWRRCVIEFDMYAQNGQTTSNNDRLKFQVVMFETTNVIEFRYSPRVRTGNPSTGSYSASCGVKGDTTVVATNWLDFSASDRTLGARNSSSNSSLRADNSDYPANAGAAVLVLEPNWPLLDRFVPVGPELVAGLVRADSEPMRTLIRNNNWLFAQHQPPLINACPYVDESAAQTFTFPVVPSADGMQYEVRVGVFSTTGGNVVLDVGRDNTASPQPGTDANWTQLTGGGQTLAAGVATVTWLTPFFVTVPATATMVRFKMTSSGGVTFQTHSISARPRARTEIDPTISYASGSGWVHGALGQLVQEGGAIHPEILNRLFRNPARVLRDRRQIVWSYIQSSVTTKATIATAITSQLAYGPASLRGQAGATLTVRLLIKDGTAGGKVRVGELGGTSVEFTLAGGGTFLLMTATLRIVSDEPVFYLNATGTGASTLTPVSCLIDWRPGD